MEVLVLGSTGYIGSRIVDNLKKKDYTVYEASKSSEKLSIDITNENSIQKLPEVDIVINAAGVGDLNGLKSDREGWSKVNQEAIRNLSNKFENTRFIHISSLSANGLENSYKKNEDDPKLPYSRSKKKSEEVVKQSFEDYTIIRPGFVFDKDNPDPIQKAFSRVNILPVNKSKTIAISRDKLSELINYCITEDVESPVLAGEQFYPEELATRTGLTGRKLYIPDILILSMGLFGEFLRKIRVRAPGRVRAKSMISDQSIENPELKQV